MCRTWRRANSQALAIQRVTSGTKYALRARTPASGTLMQRRHGFTLIEVLMVITIVGILLAVVVPRYGTVAGAMSVHSAKQEIGSLLTQGRATAIQTDQTGLVVRTAN